MKLSGSYASIARGVSQQASSQRLDGQHAEQNNLVSDPVIGLVRRRGSDYQAHTAVPFGAYLNTGDYLKSFRNFDFRKTGVQYTLMYPTIKATAAHYMLCYNKDSKQFLPVVPTSPAVEGLIKKGVNKVTQVGDLLI